MQIQKKKTFFSASLTIFHVTFTIHGTTHNTTVTYIKTNWTWLYNTADIQSSSILFYASLIDNFARLEIAAHCHSTLGSRRYWLTLLTRRTTRVSTPFLERADIKIAYSMSTNSLDLDRFFLLWQPCVTSKWRKSAQTRESITMDYVKSLRRIVEKVVEVWNFRFCWLYRKSTCNPNTNMTQVPF